MISLCSLMSGHIHKVRTGKESRDGSKKGKKGKKGKKAGILDFLPFLSFFVFFASHFIPVIKADCKNVS